MRCLLCRGPLGAGSKTYRLGQVQGDVCAGCVPRVTAGAELVRDAVVGAARAKVGAVLEDKPEVAEALRRVGRGLRAALAPEESDG